MPPSRVLHVLSQRPGWTGSGTTLQALVRGAARRGWEQAAVYGVPAGDPGEPLADLAREAHHPLEFGVGALDFALPGMSDQMPYPSSRFRDLGDEAWERYRQAWTRHLTQVIESFAPDVVHAHHLWLVSSLLPGLTQVPVLVHSHGTGLHQIASLPERAPQVLAGLQGAAGFCALHDEQAAAIGNLLDGEEPGESPARDRVHVVGAGYDEATFHSGLPAREEEILFVGKLSRAKGLPFLLEAFEGLARQNKAARLEIVGSGAGPEADDLRGRAAALPGVTLHGQLARDAVAARMRTARVCVLPSLREGLPLVLVEAAASGCRLVATALPGVRSGLAPHLGDRLTLVETPEATSEAHFARELQRALEVALALGPAPEAIDLSAFTWDAVSARIERLWRGALGQ